MESKLVFLALLLAVLATVATAADPDYSEYCRVGKAIPYNPLPACRHYITRRCAVGLDPRQLPALPKEQCCRELANLPPDCRCDALSILVNGVITEEGARVGRIEAVPGCDRQRIADLASGLPAYQLCNLQIPYGDSCYRLFGGGID